MIVFRYRTRAKDAVWQPACTHERVQFQEQTEYIFRFADPLGPVVQRKFRDLGGEVLGPGSPWK